ncbi:MAG: HAD family hydrolase [Thermanaerothrix sp.]|nr:HAD family hydrolase [Thermanaerothrix sp.]
MKTQASLPMPGVVEAAIFDFDMTLVDSSHAVTQCLNLLARDEGLDPVTWDELMATIGLPFEESLLRLFGRFDPSWPVKYRERYRQKEHSMIRPIPGALEALRELRSMGLKIGLVSNRNMLSLAAERLGVAELADVMVGLEAGLPPKPEPHMLNHAMQELRVSPQRAVYVGDTGSDVLCALNARVAPVGVATGPLGQEELKALGASMALDSVAELPALLRPLVKVAAAL